MDKQNYNEIRSKVRLDEVTLGYQSLKLFGTEELEEAQLGYGVGQSGEVLAGDNEGDWKSSWLVIAREELLGDPLFIDLDEEQLPVYTAAHGEGTWNPIMVSFSFRGFIQALGEINDIAEGRRSPVQLEQNPLSDAERETALSKIAEMNGGVFFEFWESWFEA